MIVVAIILIIASIAIPNLIRYRMSANEANATGSMRMIATGQLGFHAAHVYDGSGDGVADYGSLQQLADPFGNNEWPAFIDYELENGFRNGYQFTVAVTLSGPNTPPAYTCNGDPMELNRTGIRRFFVDASGVIRVTADGSEASAEAPAL